MGTLRWSKACIPHIKKSSHGHIMNISPPLNMSPNWFQNHVAYTMAKYGMSMCVLGMAEEFRDAGIAVNALWPRTAIHTAAIEMLTGKGSEKHSRKPEIMADAAYAIMCRNPKTCTGNFFIDDEVLREEGVTDEQIDKYSCVPGNRDNLLLDFFLDAPQIPQRQASRAFSTSAARSSQAGGSSDGGVEGIFNAIKGRLNSEIVGSTQAVFQFNLKSGGEEETWFIDLKNGEGNAGKGKPADNPDATLTMNGENFHKMFSGKLKPTNAFMTGKLKISGNLQKAMKLEKLLTVLKSKL